ncbi:beta-N-acetylhexosaminidase [Macrococcus carouselicus]|uniref:Beta-N-acetylhexosaminidase n=1 Tax=Macrococcus carouselicus TaxID=69969 RepID=A0A9Q8CLV3_9STAP|nr:beta-N-acetylhexosaminidase [Macrococcus carouselicus]TDM04451.1 beta-N-acetylhexosaminidase [Macrococcus carouselicus]
MRKLLLLILLLMCLAGCQRQYQSVKEMKSFEYKKLPAIDLEGLKVSQMTLEEKIYQMLILGFDGTEVSAELEDRLDHKLGGVILFSRNISSAEQVLKLNQQIADVQRDIPPFIGVDQEGGSVNRLPAEMGNTPPAFLMAQSGDKGYVYQAGSWNGRMLKQLGFNLDFSTVLDIWTNPANKVIGDRSFGTTPEAVTAYARAFNRGIQSEGIVTVGKHFPGHGDTLLDSHHALPVSHADMKRLDKVELVPFRKLKDEVDMMMVSHIVLSELDDKPSSLSRAVTTGLLQQQLGFHDVVITDDMAMGAIANGYGQAEAAVMAIQAGNTMVLIGSNIRDADQLVGAIAAKVHSGDIKASQIDENVQKILRLKSKYAIL